MITTPVPQADAALIAQTLNVLFTPADVIELRALSLRGRNRTDAGYFDAQHRSELISAAVRMNGRASAVYVNLNPVDPQLLARYANRIQEGATATATDANVTRRRWLLLDFDPVRPKDTSATDLQVEAAHTIARECYEYLRGEGWPEPLFAHSGNGAHLDYPLDLPNDDAARNLIKGVLKLLAARFDSKAVKLDQSVFNAGRIVKLYGTIATKGDHTELGPWRLSHILKAPERNAVVTAEQLAALVPARFQDSEKTTGGHTFDLLNFLSRLGIEYRKDVHEGRERFKLDRCPFNAEHTFGEAAIFRDSAGRLGFKCLHNSCADKHWGDVRELIDGPRESRRTRGAGEDAKGAKKSNIETWPDALPEQAYHGIAGELVRSLAPYTESDPAAILVQVLVAFGVMLGRGPHVRVEGDQHTGNLFALLVGETSKARKGTSWGRVRSIFSRVPKWPRAVSGLSSGEGLKWAVRDPLTELVQDKKTGTYVEETKDCGVDDKRLVVIEPEFAQVLRVIARPGNTLSPTLRCAWDTGNLGILTKNDPVTATGAHIAIIGHITADELRAELTQTDSANGFANRFLFACVKRSQCLPFGGAALADPVLDGFAQQIDGAVKAANTAGQVTMTEAARVIWEAIYPTLSEGYSGLFGAVTGRAEAQTLRLAALYALLDKSRQVDAVHLLAALAMWEYCAASARFVFGSSLGDPVADEILRALRAAGKQGLTRTQIRDLFKRNQSGERIGAALELLERRKLVRSEQQQTDGRPVEIWIAS